MAPTAIQPLNPKDVRLYGNGRQVTMLEALQLINKGVTLISNTRLDPFFYAAERIVDKKFELLKGAIRTYKGKNRSESEHIMYTRNWWTNTLLITNGKDNGEYIPLGKQVVFSDSKTGASITATINASFRKEYAIACELTQDNFSLTVDGITAELKILPNANVKALPPIPDWREHGRADDSTLFIPVVYDRSRGESRSVRTNESGIYITPVVSLILRYAVWFDGEGEDVNTAHSPLNTGGVLVEDIRK